MNIDFISKLLLGFSLFIMISVFSNLTVHAKSDSTKLSTIYHVSINSEYIGTVSDKGIVEKAINKLVKEQQQQYKDDILVPAQDINFIQEMTFRPVTNDKYIEDWIKSNIQIGTEATKLAFGKYALYVKNDDYAEKVLETIKNKYVKNKHENSELIEVSFSEKPILSQATIQPDKVLEIKEAIKYITKGTVKDRIHIVEKDDVLSRIAVKYALTTEQLLKLNPNLSEDTVLQIGQEINVTDYKSLLDVNVKQKLTSNEDIPYETEIIKSDAMFKGESTIKQNGTKGEKTVTYLIIQKNGTNSSKEVIKEEIRKQPVKEIVIEGTKVVPSRGTGDFSWPTVGGIVTSPMGPRWGTIHKGTDIAGVSDRSILAADNGTVTFTGWDGGYGNKIVIDHNNGYKTIYAHLQSINVKPGQTVAKGTKMGVMGTTGNSTGVHLHIELYKNGRLKDLQDYAN
ncbi:peptidoglycan DD-metalloendopeptidase family protein [Radiobacillus sp. PE A8.2]|uniref:peptidoglycan DD-metalloendopeptidase family protein n=1 Tax=Radiobacillus sp. PE A8.2 TaxID=3380349 RepID=UPI0038901DD1